MELVEESLDVNLLNNAVRLCIRGCPLLPGGVHFCELQSHLVILLITGQTVHRLFLPHPARTYRAVSTAGTTSLPLPAAALGLAHRRPQVPPPSALQSSKGLGVFSARA